MLNDKDGLLIKLNVTGGEMSNAYTHEPDPKPGQQTVWDFVLKDLCQRVDVSEQRYGTKLKTFNGRDPLWDAYQEAIDLVFYLRQAILEQESGDFE